MPATIFLIFLLLVTTIPLKAKEELTWYNHHQPPSVMLSGKYRGQGSVDRILKLLIEQLPQYRHDHLQVTMGRVLHDMESGKKVCFPAMLKNDERLKFVEFSKYSVMQHNLHVLISAKLAAQYRLKNTVGLRELFYRHGLIMAKLTARSYGKVIDEDLSEHHTSIVEKVSTSTDGLYKMLDKGRVDFLVSYPKDATFALSKLDTKRKYKTLKIKELDTFIVGSVGCSKGEWGTQVISDINTAMDRIRNTDAYFQALTAWLDDTKVDDEFHRFYQQQFLAN